MCEGVTAAVLGGAGMLWLTVYYLGSLYFPRGIYKNYPNPEPRYSNAQQFCPAHLYSTQHTSLRFACVTRFFVCDCSSRCTHTHTRTRTHQLVYSGWIHLALLH